ncbi:hypothetical protein PoB_000886600 [Plakobranchus ocellatus]|uniref:Uncharacterized protein n=1 Tax=Plakobranchus ocellatus TaxID=259542 RepID=A0AAV3YJ35_9GAST|nr:hypothetical protein PoB_000886600 [Plakobranchus ocellatus]
MERGGQTDRKRIRQSDMEIGRRADMERGRRADMEKGRRADMEKGRRADIRRVDTDRGRQRTPHASLRSGAWQSRFDLKMLALQGIVDDRTAKKERPSCRLLSPYSAKLPSEPVFQMLDIALFLGVRIKRLFLEVYFLKTNAKN